MINDPVPGWSGRLEEDWVPMIQSKQDGDCGSELGDASGQTDRTGN